ncbi:MAG: hypothetical protein KDK62_01580 [Chlamydiia bacterium]|nr:hypothetical protein [Chlamydiia bacterium]
MLRILKNFTLNLLACLATFSCQSVDQANSYADPPEELMPLSWMIGDWEDDEGDINVTYSWKWDLDKSFMVQSFTLKDQDDNPLSGRQILGWDPNEQIIRSWIFDSDGGFGESEWNYDEGTWYVNTVYTDGDGEKGSATQIYKLIDEKTLEYSQNSADMGGQFIPNEGPYKFVRKR